MQSWTFRSWFLYPHLIPLLQVFVHNFFGHLGEGGRGGGHFVVRGVGEGGTVLCCACLGNTSWILKWVLSCTAFRNLTIHKIQKRKHTQIRKFHFSIIVRFRSSRICSLVDFIEIEHMKEQQFWTWDNTENHKSRNTHILRTQFLIPCHILNF